MTPINVPLYGSPIARTLNRLLLILQLRLVMLILRMRKPIIWAAIPTAADIVSSLGGKLLVYQVSDKYDFNEDSALSRSVIREMDTRLKQLAAVVMYSGRKLYEAPIDTSSNKQKCKKFKQRPRRSASQEGGKIPVTYGGEYYVNFRG